MHNHVKSRRLTIKTARPANKVKLVHIIGNHHRPVWRQIAVQNMKPGRKPVWMMVR
jgi:hypothetical protein